MKAAADPSNRTRTPFNALGECAAAACTDLSRGHFLAGLEELGVENVDDLDVVQSSDLESIGMSAQETATFLEAAAVMSSV